MKNIYRRMVSLSLVLLWNLSAHAQQDTIWTQNFSDEYAAFVLPLTTTDTIRTAHGGMVPKFVVQVFSQENRRDVLKAYTSDLPAYRTDERDTLRNVLFYEDYNFDGRKDLAVMNGYYSCYGGPSYDIYLSSDTGFVYHPAFSALSNEYCGMFDVDSLTHTLKTTLKSGCCWHQFSGFSVIDNQPELVWQKTVDRTGILPFLMQELRWDRSVDPPAVAERLFLTENDNQEALGVIALEGNCRIVLFAIDQVLYCALERPDFSLVFYYPQPFSDEEKHEMSYAEFVYNTRQNTLSFVYEDIRYTIYNDSGRISLRAANAGQTEGRRGLPDDMDAQRTFKGIQRGTTEEKGIFKWKNVKYHD